MIQKNSKSLECDKRSHKSEAIEINSVNNLVNAVVEQCLKGPVELGIGERRLAYESHSEDSATDEEYFSELGGSADVSSKLKTSQASRLRDTKHSPFYTKARPAKLLVERPDVKVTDFLAIKETNAVQDESFFG